MPGERGRPPLRVFADNGSWWALNASDVALHAVIVRVLGAGAGEAISGLCATVLEPTEQRRVDRDPRPGLVTLEATWESPNGAAGRLQVQLRADGHRATGSH